MLGYRRIAPGEGGVWAPPVDIYETDEAFVLKAELPASPKAT
jgi:HSP20 family molecular chaperone IbpA